MKILMTGSTGYIGSHLYSKLIKSGYDIKVILNKKPIMDSETLVEEKDIHKYVNHYKKCFMCYGIAFFKYSICKKYNRIK